MKQFILIAAAMTLVVANADAQKKKPAPAAKNKAAAQTATLKNAADTFAYALGMNIANNLVQQGVDKANTDLLKKGLDDIFAGNKTFIDEQQANMSVQQMLKEYQEKRNNALKQKGIDFLEANKKRAGVITLPSGLQYEVIKKGDPKAAMPKLEDTVDAHYAGTLIDGKEFDNSYKRGEPLTIPVGGVIKGWTEALQLMHEGDKWKVYIPAELGYGERGAGSDIPPHATLIFEMELIKVKPAASKPAEGIVTPEPVKQN